MKRIETVVQSEISRKVVKAIRDTGVGGVTLIESLGQGAGDRPEIGGKQIEFNSTDVIITVVNDSEVNSVVSAIMDTAHTGQKGDGKIFVTNVEESFDISTKQKSTEKI
ncbi:MAG: P-II family nitrogen regulator [Nitrosopumilaceae archaeon]|jgi:nitrogen regulatory protein PII|uniref:P-II family nitrogen regulator n=2 Tax=Candidatus Nitrosomaritimum aestuariumsis TaxID=3342354 RepID=A0AC60W7G1_9ARCH|nr:P-II family nitrogen regulator [Nitrosopumilaceae archaeon]MBA4460024.1 P-II family nitrogen regulator [Nitrosopumilaceae archaeon]MBA4461942.1 P-II family nitrogen regulator [Nitrosopumilaceae archaeon]MBA4463064.1 P-II family nitrogen regulator [Nitrosopumilaceae archaeon]